MNAMDILKPYLDRPTDTQEDFDEVARQVPSSALAGGLADAFRSDKTPDFGQMAAFHAEHPEVVKVLGGAALAIALGQVATRMRR